MTSDNTENQQPRYTLKPTFTPLPHSTKASGQSKGHAKNCTDAPKGAPNSMRSTIKNEDGKQSNKPGMTANVNSVIRAANEDDDLYDPYSDYHDGTLRAATFEEDPWR